MLDSCTDTHAHVSRMSRTSVDQRVVGVLTNVVLGSGGVLTIAWLIGCRVGFFFTLLKFDVDDAAIFLHLRFTITYNTQITHAVVRYTKFDIQHNNRPIEFSNIFIEP